MTITVDNQLRTPDDDSAPILLYDGINEVYYRTTIKHVITVALMESKQFMKDMETQISEFESAIQRRQDEFISDMVKTNETLINFVKAGTK